MKRMQIYRDEEMARTLETLSRQKGTIISELVRAGLRERYMQNTDLDKVSLARSLTRIWKNRKDPIDIDAAVQCVCFLTTCACGDIRNISY
ncbi:MAG: CopG family transcriptional regulator [Acidobacteriota bacterium]|jgi:hypothetical protein